MSSTVLKACAIAFAGLASFAAAPLASAQPSGEVADICQRVLVLEPGEKHFAACVESLSRSAQSMRHMARPAGETPVPDGTRSYFVISREAAFRRDQLACEQLGFEPSEEAFGACATDLKVTLARASEPAM